MRKRHRSSDSTPLWRPHELPISERDRAWYLFLCRPCFVHALVEHAGHIAIRRSLRDAHDLGDITLSEQAILSVVEVWERLSDEERLRRALAEIDRYDELVRRRGAHQGLTEWIETPERALWLPKAPDPITRRTFDKRLAADRRRVDTHRACRDPIATLWRSHVPGWCAGMSGERAVAFDRMLYDFQTRVGVYFRDGSAPLVA